MSASPRGALAVILMLSCLAAAPPARAQAGVPADLGAAAAEQAAVRQALARFMIAVQAETHDALLPTLTAADRAAIDTRRALGQPVFAVKELAGLWRLASANAKEVTTAEALSGMIISLTEPDRARADIQPLLSFRASIHLAREEGAWRVDLARTLQCGRQPRPKEEILSLCRQALRGIAEDVDVVQTEHFLLLTHTGPEPTRAAIEALEALYNEFQERFPFDQGRDDAPGAPSVARVTGPDPYMVVFLFSHAPTYRKFTERYAPGSRRAAGFATPSGYFATCFGPTFHSLVRHEGTHLLMYRRMRLFGAPNWLAEGMAETMADPNDAPVSDRKLREMLRQGKKLGLGPLMDKQKIAAGTDYHLSQSLVHFLRRRHPEQWDALIRFTRQFDSPHPAECRTELLRLLDMDQSQLDAAWREHLLQVAVE